MAQGRPHEARPYSARPLFALLNSLGVLPYFLKNRSLKLLLELKPLAKAVSRIVPPGSASSSRQTAARRSSLTQDLNDLPFVGATSTAVLQRAPLPIGVAWAAHPEGEAFASPDVGEAPAIFGFHSVACGGGVLAARCRLARAIAR